MLNSLLKPVTEKDVLRFKVPMNKDSIMPLILLVNYGIAVKWALKNPKECIGKSVSAAPFQLTFDEIAQAVQQVTGKENEFIPITVEEWMTNISVNISPESRLPRSALQDDPASFTFRQTFGAWWNIWKDNKQVFRPKNSISLEETSDDTRKKTLQDWMLSVNYDPSG
jgi:hypothetical protein